MSSRNKSVGPRVAASSSEHELLRTNLSHVSLSRCAVFSALIRLPLTAVLIVFEIMASVESSLSLAVPMLCASVVAHHVATEMESRSFYEQIVVQDGADADMFTGGASLLGTASIVDTSSGSGSVVDPRWTSLEHGERRSFVGALPGGPPVLPTNASGPRGSVAGLPSRSPSLVGGGAGLAALPRVTASGYIQGHQAPMKFRSRSDSITSVHTAGFLGSLGGSAATNPLPSIPSAVPSIPSPASSEINSLEGSHVPPLPQHFVQPFVRNNCRTHSVPARSLVKSRSNSFPNAFDASLIRDQSGQASGILSLGAWTNKPPMNQSNLLGLIPGSLIIPATPVPPPSESHSSPSAIHSACAAGAPCSANPPAAEQHLLRSISSTSSDGALRQPGGLVPATLLENQPFDGTTLPAEDGGRLTRHSSTIRDREMSSASSVRESWSGMPSLRTSFALPRQDSIRSSRTTATASMLRNIMKRQASNSSVHGSSGELGAVEVASWDSAAGSNNNRGGGSSSGT